MEQWASVLEELIKVSPYAVLLVLAFVLFYFMHKSSIDKINENMSTAITEIRKAYSDANDKLERFYRKVTN